MSNTPTTNNHQEEIDLGFLFKKVNEFFKRTIKLLFEVIGFFIKYKLIVFVLFLIGIAFGFYKDSNSEKAYDNEVIVIPNFESVDYLYSKVNALNSKIKLKDTVYLNNVLGDYNHKYLKKIEITPIIDLFNFASESRENIDVLRILIQNQELESFADHIVASKYYKYHKLNINIVGQENSRLIVEKLFLYFNSNEHFIDYKEASAENIDLQIIENKNMILQIDSLLSSLNDLSNTERGASVVINNIGNLQLLIEKKQELLDEHLFLLYKRTDERQIIKEVSTSFNIILDSGIIINRTVKYPLYLILLFSLIFFVRYSYKSLKEIAHQ